MKLPDDEQEAINRARRDSEGWVMPMGVPEHVRRALEAKGLIRYWRLRWQLTPLGFTHTPTFQRGDRVLPQD